MSKGRESLAFVKDRQVVLLIKQILEFHYVLAKPSL